jgi:CheY-like chemotaxis protein
VPISADAVRLGQVISNLLTNAIRYTEPGGAITVTVAAEGDRATVRVKDTGIGIASEWLSRVFEAFRQAPSLAHSKGGLGIGLAVAQSLAELHGGQLEAFSEGLGRGSEFVLRLPLGNQPASAPEPGTVRTGQARGQRVLLADDSADLRESMAILLELMGHTVITAEDGRTAIEMARREKPDAALIDIGLPDINGYEVAHALREDAQTRGLRLVALTGYATPEHRDRALRAGFDQHLAKPIDADQLQRVLDGGVPSI